VYAPAAGVAVAEYVEKVRLLAAGGTAIRIEGAPRVLANVTRLGARKALAVHLLNYAPEPVSGVRVRLTPGAEFASLASARPACSRRTRAPAVSPARPAISP